MRELQMQVLDYVDAFCRKNNIRYTISGGTLLGAVRHGGYIPWDDDMDIQMLRSEYDRFSELWNKTKEEHPYEYVSIESGNSLGYVYGKVHNPKTITLLHGVERTGVYIDVFPVDDVLDEDDFKRRYAKRKKLYQSMFAAFAIETNNYLGFAHKLVYKFRARGKNRNYYAEQINNLAKANNGKGARKVFEMVSGFLCKHPMDKAIFEDYADIKFENRVYMAVKDYDSYLTETFGDYMTPPPVEQQKSHHAFVPYWK